MGRDGCSRSLVVTRGSCRILRSVELKAWVPRSHRPRSPRDPQGTSIFRTTNERLPKGPSTKKLLWTSAVGNNIIDCGVYKLFVDSNHRPHLLTALRRSMRVAGFLLDLGTKATSDGAGSFVPEPLALVPPPFSRLCRTRKRETSALANKLPRRASVQRVSSGRRLTADDADYWDWGSATRNAAAGRLRL